jgi:ubiquitin carboxyl-terminal hydrolase 7
LKPCAADIATLPGRMTVIAAPPEEDDEMLVPPQDFNDVIEPMEVVGQGEGVATVENQLVDDPQTGKFTWTIDNFSKINLRKHYSETFTVGGYKWRVLLFPKGNNVDHLSVYLDVADSAQLPYGWSRFAHFTLAVVNQYDPKLTVKKDTQHQFNVRESDWGFTSFMPLQDLYDPSRAFLVNDTLIVEADVNVSKVVD